MEKEEINTAPKTNKIKHYIKKVFKVLLYIILGFVLLNVTLYVLLSIPAVQNKVISYVVDYLKPIVKTELSIDEVRLKLFNNVQLKGVYVEDQSQDTLVYAQNIEVGLSPWKLLHKELEINKIDLDNFTIKISQKNPDSDFNFQFLIDAFSGDSTKTDTTSSSLKIKIENINLKNGKLDYDVLSEPLTPHEFNASHIHIYNLNAKVQLPSIDTENFKGTVSSLSFIEHSGIVVEDFKADVTSDKSTFYIKEAEMKLPLSSLSIPTAYYNIDKNEFKVRIASSRLSPKDIQPFYYDIKYLRNDIVLEGNIKGNLPTLSIDSLSLQYGDQTILKANAYMSDVMRYNKSQIDLSIDQLLVTSADITDFARLGDSTFVSPDILASLGNIRLVGSLKGTFDGFNIQADAWARHGALKMVTDGMADSTFNNFKANVRLQTQNFNLGSLLQMPDMGKVSAYVNLNASQSDKKPLSADVKGEVSSIEYNKQTYKQIPFTAFYNSIKMGAWLKGDLPLGYVEADVNMTQSRVPKIDVDLDVRKLRLDYLIDSLGWENPELTFELKGNITGLDLNNINANLSIDNFLFSRDTISFRPGPIQLIAVADKSPNKVIQLSSSLLNASISGDYNFAQFSSQINNFIHDYLPGLFPKVKRIPLKTKPNIFNFSLLINNSESLGEIFGLSANIIQPLSLDGSINTETNKVLAKVKLPLLEYGEIKIRNTEFNLSNSDSIINLKGFLNLYRNNRGIDFRLDTKIEADTINALLTAKRDSADFEIDMALHTLANFKYSPKGELISSLSFFPTEMSVGKLILTFLPAEIKDEGDRTSISNFGFMEGRGRVMNRYLGVDGVISEAKEDTLNVYFDNANLGYILKAFDIENISAIADGNIKLTNLKKQPELYTNNLQFENIVFFNDTLGDFKIRSKWNNSEDAIAFRAFLEKSDRKSEVAGYVFPDKDSLNLKVNLDRFSINWIEPFMADMLNRVSGSISSGLRVTGRISSPETKGWVSVNNAYIGVDYTNVTYHISDTIQISPDKIGFDNLIIEDPDKNKARVNALVTHQNFSDIKYNLDMNLNNFLVLNTAGRTDSLFYGKVYASGKVNIKGTEEDMNINMTVRNAKNSFLNIQLPQTEDATTYQSIVYINTPQEENKKAKQSPKQEESTFPIKLAVNLTLTPDMLFNVVIDPTTGDALQAKGSGLIDFYYNTASENMNVFGDYTLSDGSVRIRLQNIKTLDMQIQNGSKLFFVGDPMKTQFDITAYKRVKADLVTLDPSFGNDANGSTKVTAECLLGITGNIDQMNLTYDVALPDANSNLQDQVSSLIATNEQKIKQFAYLLVMGTFYSGSSGTGGNITDGMLTNLASGVLSKGLDMLFGNVLGDKWTIGTNISSNDGTFNDMDMSISVSRKFLDDKLQFNSNIGYRTDIAANSNNAFIGDFDVEYILNRSLKLKVFNKTNDRYYLQAPMTQGVGIVYTREAKTLKELFHSFRKKKYRPSRPQTEGAK